ncbi:hypothetical protein M408DRAFT_22668 [Serendipita vermifera MAFF 305830]|uniref:FK506-binding protein n=1 Tax=Serendipita vermifera MAFF 305830 TaxID=933852 RepID=A0A0C2WUF6_SERVB|nr:hypothetical protein M408DRAFT_22668 [Serendipita vermifera MAFF 305830]
MPLPVHTWAIELNPSEKKTFELTDLADLKITAATLDPVLKDQTGRSTVILHITHKTSKDSDSEDESEEEEEEEISPTKLVLTSLTPGKTESMLLDSIITRPATVVCEVIGKNTIHLSGYLYVNDTEIESHDDDDDEEYPGDFNILNMKDDDDDDDESDEDYPGEMEYDLEPDESELEDMDRDAFAHLHDSGRFEEVDELEEEDEAETEKPAEIPKKQIEATKKRPRESEEEEETPKLSKKQKKKLKAQQAAAEAALENNNDGPPQKKQKAEDGKPVAVSTSKKETPPAKNEANGNVAPATKSEKEKGKGEKKEKEKSNNGTETTTGQTVKHPNGLSVTDSKVGTGATAKKGSRLSMRYIGKLSNGKVFDSNTNGRPFQFRLGNGEVIKGWDQGLLGMKVGGERLLVIPPALAYGKQKTGGIPPNSTLTFEVKLLDIS